MGNEIAGAKAPKVRVKLDPDKTFQVNSEGYTETFDTKMAALAQTEILKKRAVKNQEEITVTVKELGGNGKAKEVHKLKIGEDYYK